TLRGRSRSLRPLRPWRHSTGGARRIGTRSPTIDYVLLVIGSVPPFPRCEGRPVPSVPSSPPPSQSPSPYLTRPHNRPSRRDMTRSEERRVGHVGRAGAYPQCSP